MKRTLHVAAAVTIAVAVQGLVARAFGDARVFVDLPLVAVVYAALSSGRVAGLLAGTVAGLAQDGIAGGVLGIGGLAKSLAGFTAGIVGTQFIVTQTVPRVLVFIGATLLSAGVFMGLHVMLGLRQFPHPWLDVTLQACLNGLVGAAAFAMLDALPGVRERWRARREYRREARFR
jgi:rod shape-determining protein MreD